MIKNLELLGLRVEDVVTGFSGVVTSISFDLYGCIQALVTPAYNVDKHQDSRWFDLTRLRVVSNKPVMAIPDFAGGQDLPMFYEKP